MSERNEMIACVFKRAHSGKLAKRVYGFDSRQTVELKIAVRTSEKSDGTVVKVKGEVYVPETIEYVCVEGDNEWTTLVGAITCKPSPERKKRSARSA